MNSLVLWLVRHPQPLIADGVCYGSSDIPAAAAATLRQAAELAAVLPERIPLWCSPLQRCSALARALQEQRADLACRHDDRLRELDFGAWEGLRWSQIGQQAVDAWIADFAGHRVGGGESVQGLLQRVGDALQATREHCQLSGAREAAWITHAGVIRAVVAWAAGIRRMDDAGRWPADAPGFGGWLRCAIPCREHEQVAFR